MDQPQKSALLRMDMRDPSRASECLDGMVAFPAAVERMRASGEDTFAHTMVTATRVAFDRLDASDQAGLLFVALEAQDLLYRHIVQLTVLDHYTRTYCSVAVRDFFERLRGRRIRAFFILDNPMREDCFQAVLELFECSGIATVTPRRDGPEWSVLATRLREGLDRCGHVAYIEPDAAVDHLESARQLASELPCVATFRNGAPEDPVHEIINFTDLER